MISDQCDFEWPIRGVNRAPHKRTSALSGIIDQKSEVSRLQAKLLRAKDEKPQMSRANPRFMFRRRCGRGLCHESAMKSGNNRLLLGARDRTRTRAFNISLRLRTGLCSEFVLTLERKAGFYLGKCPRWESNPHLKIARLKI
jgi:hypothetical protein